MPTNRLSPLSSASLCAAIVWATWPILAVGGAETDSAAASVVHEASGPNYVAVGTLAKNRRKSAEGFDYVVRDERSGTAYFVLPSQDIALEPLVGRRVAVAGKVRYRPDKTSGFVWPREVRAFGDPVRLVQNVEELPQPGAQSKPEPTPAPPPPEDLPAPQGELLVEDGEPDVDGALAGEACQDCQRSHSTCSRCRCRRPGCYWVRLEYLLWWADGMNVPPLVTTSPPGTAAEDAGVLGRDGTRILFGDDEILNGARSGGRVRFGFWLDPCRREGLEAEWFGLNQDALHFRAASNDAGEPILARPFMNMNPEPAAPPREDSELVSYPGILSGAVMVDVASSLTSVGVRKRIVVCRRDSSCCNPCGGGCRSSHWDVLIGYRYLRLKESLLIREDLTSLDPANPGDFDIFDSFDTRNEFHGGEIGVLWEVQRHRWTLEAISKLALGGVSQDVEIRGGTTISEAGVATSYPGGLLAQRTNSGLHSRQQFAVLPELDLTLGWRFTQRLKAVFGYTLVYLSPVVRPGDQIDLDVNPDLLPPEAVPFTGPLRPRFVLHDADYWAQGFSVGLDYSW